MELVANIFGIAAVVIFALSFQSKTRSKIISLNILSRVFYIAQYIFLFAFEGAAFDLIGAFATIPASKKDTGIVKRYKTLILIAIFGTIVIAGALLYKDLWSILPVVGVSLEIAALWVSEEKKIRIISFLSQPFWLVYNLRFLAFGSAFGNAFTMISILIALYRFRKSDIKGRENAEFSGE